MLYSLFSFAEVSFLLHNGNEILFALGCLCNPVFSVLYTECTGCEYCLIILTVPILASFNNEHSAKEVL